MEEPCVAGCRHETLASTISSPAPRKRSPKPQRSDAVCWMPLPYSLGSFSTDSESKRRDFPSPLRCQNHQSRVPGCVVCPQLLCLLRSLHGKRCLMESCLQAQGLAVVVVVGQWLVIVMVEVVLNNSSNWPSTLIQAN